MSRCTWTLRASMRKLSAPLRTSKVPGPMRTTRTSSSTSGKSGAAAPAKASWISSPGGAALAPMSVTSRACGVRSIRTLPRNSATGAAVSGIPHRLAAYLGAHRIGDEALRVRAVVERFDVAALRQPLAREADAGPQRHAQHRGLAGGVLPHDAHGLVGVLIDAESPRRCERQEEQHVAAGER